MGLLGLGIEGSSLAFNKDEARIAIGPTHWTGDLQLLYHWDMELRHIRYFLAVAGEKNFTRAAAIVGIGQSPLSQQIKDLEQEIGAPLFHRVPQGAELTSAGEAFLDVVRVFPELAARAMQVAQRAARGETGSLNVGFTASSAFNPVVPGAIRAFRIAYPDVLLSVVPASMSQLAVENVVYRAIRENAPMARIALATRRSETSTIVRNFVTRAVPKTLAGPSR